jgi:phenylacetate-CoA ligase
MSGLYADLANVPALLHEYPLGPVFLARFSGLSTDALHHLQNQRFRTLMARGWQVPFYRRLWSAQGLEPGDIQSLDHLPRLPVYDKSDLMASLAAHPPFGDYHGLAQGLGHAPLVLQTTSGTTGKPQLLLFGPRGREIGNILVARMALWQGLADGDVVHSVYGHGLINGGHYIREAFTQYTGSLFISAGTGSETRSTAQVRLMHELGATVAVGFIDYIRKLADVARAEGLVPGEDIRLRMIIGHLGTEDRRSLEETWGGARAFDWYGLGDTGCIAAEGPERDGLHIWEDAHHVEILGPDHAPLADGTPGNLVVTSLYKTDVAPVIRFNTHDVSAIVPGTGAVSLPFRRIRGFLGRSDNMIKYKGINIYPHAIAALLEHDANLTGEYLCHLSRTARGEDALTITLEHRHPAADPAPHAERLRAGLGVEVAVRLVPPGATAALTHLDDRQKPLRLIDERQP